MDGVKVSLPLLILMLLKLSKVFQMQETHVELPSSFYLHQGFVGILELFRHVKKEVCSMLHIGIRNGCGQEKRQRQQPAHHLEHLDLFLFFPQNPGRTCG
jgi:hypothetical protein